MDKVPRLRFKEFSGEWENIKLKNIAKKIIKKNIKNEINIVLTNSAEKGIIKQEDFFDKEIANEKNIDTYYIVDKDSFVYNPRISKLAPYGPINRNHLECGVVSPLYLVFDVKKENRNFIEKYFKSSYWFKYMYDIGNSGVRSDRMNISNNDFFDMNLFIPNLEEQEKIGNFLSSVDKKISIVEEKLNLFNQYKKGIMQKIFSQELRFKDENGNNYPQWEEKFLGEIADCLDNKRKPLNSAEREKIKGNIPYYGANGIQGYINDFLFDEELVLLAEDGGNFEDFSIKPIAQYICGKSWVNNHAHILKGKKETLTRFLFYSLVHRDIRSFINGTSRSKLNKSDMLNIIINLPCLEEQEKIANFLSAIDDKIENISGNLENLKLFKKSMLQKMFV